MKRIAALLFLSVTTLGNFAFATVTRMQYAVGSVNPGTSFNVVSTQTIHDTDILVAIVCSTDNASGLVNKIQQTGVTWSQVTSTADVVNGADFEMFIGKSVSGASPTAAVTLNRTRAASAYVIEYSGIIANPLDVTAVGVPGLSNPANSGTTATTAVSTEVWVAGFCDNLGSVSTVNNSFTIVNTTSITSGSTALTNHFLEKMVFATGTAEVNQTGALVPGQSTANGIATFMGIATTVVSSPTTCVDATGVGTVSWTTPSNAQSADLVLSSAQINNVSAATDASVRLVNAAGNLVGVDKADLVTNWATYPAVSTVTYGTSTDTWSSGVTYTDVNSSNFGIKLAAQQLSAPTTSHFLYCDGYNLNIPNCSIPQGIQATVRKNGQAIKSFVVGTQVYTPLGEISIEKLKAGDTVYSYDFENDSLVKTKILRTQSHNDPRITYVDTTEGMVACSPEHQFFTDKGVRQIKDLSVGDKLKMRYGYARIISMQTLEGSTPTYEIFLGEPHNYYANGFLVHNVTNGVAQVDMIWLAVTYTPALCPATGGGGNMQQRRFLLED